MAAKKKSNGFKILFVVAVAFIIGSAFGYFLVPEKMESQQAPLVRLASLKIPAVDGGGKGVLADLTVEIKPGTGKILTDIENLMFWADTQQSIRLAREATQKHTGANLSNYDLTYTITAPYAQLIGGQSAGAALAVATTAALKGRQIRQDITITGMIDEEGKILPVAGLKEKAEAAYSANITTFLIPAGQGDMETLEPVKECREAQRNGFYYRSCSITFQKARLSSVGPKVYEVGDLREALDYFGL